MGHASIAFIAALLCPTLLLVVGPLLLGVPHLASDLRYLVLRRSGDNGWRATVFPFCVVLFGLRVLETQHLDDAIFARVEVALLIVWLVAALLLRASARPNEQRRLLAVLAGTGVLGTFAWQDPTLFRAVFAHAHNVVGLVVWYALFRKPSRLGLLPAGFVLGGAALLFFVGGSVPEALGWPEWFDLHISTAASWLAPGLPANQQFGLVLSYAFLQSVHYAVWLIFIPQDAHRGRGTTTFSASLRSAWSDFRPWGVLAIVLGTLAVLSAACFDPLMTSAVYLFVTPFHGYLELVVLAIWLSTSSAKLSGVARRA